MNSSAVNRSELLHRLFRVGVFVKGIHAVIELITAIVLYLVSGTTLSNIITSAANGELFEDPNDFIATVFLQHASALTGSGKDFATLYLFIGALVNGMLSFGLLAGKRIAFPTALSIMTLFVLYQLYLFARTHSPWLIFFIAFDCIVLWLIYKEYLAHFKHAPTDAEKA